MRREVLPVPSTNIATLACIRRQHDVSIARLHKAARNDKVRADSYTHLAELLEQCAPHRRCRSGACPVCIRRAQLRFTDRMVDFFNRIGEPISILSIVLPLRLRPGCSTGHARRRFGRMISQLRRDLSCLPWVLGGIDVSANEHAAGKYGPYYQFQLWAFADQAHVRIVEKKLRKRFTANRRVLRPLRVISFDGDPCAIAYALKPNFTRRVTLPAISDRQADRLGVEPRRQNTKNQPLHSGQEAELRLILHNLGLHLRLQLFGVVKCKGRFSLARSRPSRGGTALIGLCHR